MAGHAGGQDQSQVRDGHQGQRHEGGPRDRGTPQQHDGSVQFGHTKMEVIEEHDILGSTYTAMNVGHTIGFILDSLNPLATGILCSAPGSLKWTTRYL